MRTEEIMTVIAENNGQSLEELVETLGVGPMQLDALVAFIIAACGQK